MRLRHAPFVALVLLLVPAIAAQTDPADNRIRAEMKRQNIPGLSLAVVKNGVIVKAEGYGFTNIKLKTPATPATVYKIASASKQFIATGIMLLVQDGRIRVDDPISKYLEGTPASWNGVTIRHLLTHTSGLIREAPGFDPLKIQPDAQHRIFRPGRDHPHGRRAAMERVPGGEGFQTDRHAVDADDHDRESAEPGARLRG